MIKSLIGLMTTLTCIGLQAEEAVLKDPTAPFNSARSAPVNGPRTAPKITGPRWTLDGVLISAEGKKALVNGRWYKEHDHIDGWQLVQVDTAAVVLKQASKTQRILLFPSLTNTTLTLKPES